MGLRCPEHPTAQALLLAAQRWGVWGVAAPSANRFGRVSPTTAEHVASEFEALSEAELIDHHIVRRVSDHEVRLMSKLLPEMAPGALLNDHEHLEPVFRAYWKRCSSESFALLPAQA